MVSFNTNANLLDEQKAQAILGSNLDGIILSVDGPNKETNVLESSLRSMWQSNKLSEMWGTLWKSGLEKISRCNVHDIINVDLIRKKSALGRILADI